MKKYLSFILLLTTGYGCTAPVEPQDQPSTTSPALRGTIGAVCELSGYDSIKVQGYSLVFGLPGTGSSDCPKPKEDYLVEQIRRLNPQRYMSAQNASLSAEQIIRSHSTAVVLVTGFVPAGAPKGQKFDVEVTALPATQTTSLQGGFLMETQLQVVVPGPTGRLLPGRPTARAAGPIFINPFPLSADPASKTDPRRGVVLGGGCSLYDRHIRLSILQPDSLLAQQIQRRINARFGQPDEARVADSTRSTVNLQVPAVYRDRYRYFIKLVLALYLADSPGAMDMKLKELGEWAAQPGADYEAIALAWEAIGRNALPYLAPLYDNGSSTELAFYAARTALNLGNRGAIDALVLMAMDNHHPCQALAVQTLGGVSTIARARAALTKLLDQPNARLRLLAYDGLRRSQDRAIKSLTLPADFKLETVTCSAENLICIWATDEPRIALFGNDLRCRPNVFFQSDDHVITLNAGPNDDHLTIIRQLPDSQDFTTLESPLVVKDLIKMLAMPVREPGPARPAGAGLTFSQIVGILHGLCRDRVIPGKFILHRLPEDLIG